MQFTVTDVSDEWMWVEVPFFMFEPKARESMIDWADIRQMVVVFSDTVSEPDGWVMLDYFYAADGMLTF